jgi:hypothetical protein
MSVVLTDCCALSAAGYANIKASIQAARLINCFVIGFSVVRVLDAALACSRARQAVASQ